MLEIDIPGYKKLELSHLVLDYNGTMACDGILLDGVKAVLENLAKSVNIHVLTADTFGKVKAALSDLPCSLTITPPDNQQSAKLEYIEALGAAQSVCIGNGRNDRLMLKEAGLGIAVVQEEGASAETIMAADVVVCDIKEALDLLMNPLRLVATLRS